MATDPELTYDLSLLRQSREKWARSPGLRLYYGSLYRDIAAHLVEGSLLELGSGIGNGKEFLPDLVTSDVVKTDYVDLAASCYDLLALGRSWDNLVALDVFHHLRRPMEFLREAGAVLNTGGRLILMEPASTPWARVFYGLCHPEPVRPSDVVPPYVFDDGSSGEFANMALAREIFLRQKAPLEEVGLKLVTHRYRDLIGYAFTGGYSKPQLLPTPVLRAVLGLERRLPASIARWTGLRLLLVLEKV